MSFFFWIGLRLCIVVTVLGAVGCGAARSEHSRSGARLHTLTAAPTTSAQLARQGLQLLATGDSLRAEQYLQLAIEAGHPDAPLIGPLLDACIASSRLRAALSHAEVYLRKHPSAWRVRHVAATMHSALGDDAVALEELQRVIDARPDAPEALYLSGVLHRDAFQDERRAALRFRAYLTHAPQGAHAEELTAWLREHQLRERQAQQSLLPTGAQ